MFDLFAELSGLTAEVREHRLVMLRIAEALERISPPLQPDGERDSDAGTSGAGEARRRAGSEEESYSEHYLAESPEEYMARTDRESALAMSLGVAPWSPDFQKSIMEVRAELMKPRVWQDEEGNWQTREALTEAEADDSVREGFRIAKSASNERREGA
jgi:hypothetical protein